MARLTSILLLLDRLAARADLCHRRGEVEVESLVHVPRPPQTQVADLIDHLGAAAPLTGSVLVLTDEVFLQTLELPPKALSGLGDEALHHALAYEAQSFSGLSSADAELAWQRRPNDRHFHVAQLSRAELEAIDDSVRRMGGALAGVAHPAALPLPLADVAEGERFHRVEDWGSVRASVRGTGNRVERTRVHRSGSLKLDDEPITEHLTTRAPVGSNGTGVHFDLDADDTLRLWLVRWARAYARRAEGFVVITPPTPGATRWTRLLRSAVLVALAVIACTLDYSAQRQTALSAGLALASARAPLLRLQAAESEVLALERQLEELRGAPRAAGVATTRWSAGVAVAILEGLAAERPAGLIVDGLDLGWNECTVRGRASEAVLVDRLAARLSPRLSQLGYEVSPAARKRQEGAPGGVFEFSFDLLEAGAALPPAAREDDR